MKTLNELKFLYDLENHISELLRTGRSYSIEDFIRKTKDLKKDIEDLKLISFKEKSSAEKMNKILMYFHDEIEKLSQIINSSTEALSLESQRALEILSSVIRKAEELSRRLNGALLTYSNRSSSVVALGDNFADTSKINLEESSVQIDLESQSVYLDTISEIENEKNFLDTSFLTEDDISVKIITSETHLSPGTQDSSVLDMFTDSERGWLFSVATTQREAPGIEVKIDLRRNPLYNKEALSKIVVVPFITAGSYTLSVQLSEDGITWIDAGQDATRTIAQSAIFFFDETPAKFIRLALFSNMYNQIDQRGRAVHNFGIKKIKIGTNESAYKKEGVLKSKPYSKESFEGNKLFSMASVETCDHIPEDTEIEYSILFLDSDNSLLYEHQIVPSNSTKSGPKVVDISRVLKEENLTKISTTIEGYPGVEVSNIYPLEKSIETTDIDVWRNVGNKTRLYSIIQEDHKVVEDGWRYENGIYSTYIFIKTPEGQDFDFGPTSITINRQEVTGTIRLSYGIHKIETKEENWFSLSGLTSVSFFDTSLRQFQGERVYYGETGIELTLSESPFKEEVFRIVDPLYPYNHKLIIEGLTFTNRLNNPFIRQQYKGVDLYASQLLNKLSLNDFLHSSSSDVFTISKAASDQGGLTDVVLVKWNKTTEDSSREEFVIVEETKTSVSQIALKAILRTDNPSKTPSIDGYILRVIE